MLFELELDNALHTGNRHELERLKQQKNGCLPRTITPYYDVGAHYETYRTPCTLKKLADKYQHPELKAHL